MFDNNYKDEKSDECLCFEELTEFLKEILGKLKLFNGQNIDEYMFNNKLTKNDRSLILNTIKEDLKTYLAKGKLKYYRKFYDCLSIDELINPDLFVWRYCTAYCYMNNFYNYSEALFETYFSCCISKTEEEVEEEYQTRRKREKEELLKRDNENEEKKFQKIYGEIQHYLPLTETIDEDTVRSKYELAKNYSSQLLAWSIELSKASNKSRAIYCIQMMYNIYMNAIENNCVGFDYHNWYREIVSNRNRLDLFSLDIESMRLFILDYRKKQEHDKIATDLEVNDIYCKALKKR